MAYSKSFLSMNLIVFIIQAILDFFESIPHGLYDIAIDDTTDMQTSI